MDGMYICKDMLGLIFSLLPGQYSTFVILCREMKELLKCANIDGWDALIARGVSVEIDDYTITWYKNGKKTQYSRSSGRRT